jgi:folate-binding protein YgfZ
MAEPDGLAAVYALARKRGALFDLSGRAKWRLSGADRIRYLNGQVTNDIRRVKADAAMAACVTTAKGRLCGVVFVSAGPEFLRIDAEEELRESLGARLERYIIADDATLEDTTGQECLLHALPPAGAGERPESHGAEVRTATRFGRAGWDIMAARGDRERLLGEFSADYEKIPGELLESIRIEAGVPKWGAELTEETLPPEAGLDASAIDYVKGCYIGQEVISRIKSVGHVNRSLAGFTSVSPLAAGMTLHPVDEPEANAGEITSAAWSFGLDTWVGLGYHKRGCADRRLLARSPDGTTAEVKIRRSVP